MTASAHKPTEALAKLDRMFESHPSLSASLEDFEHNDKTLQQASPTMVKLPSQHSGFREDSSEAGGNDSTTSDGPWSPPGGTWKSTINSPNGWYRHNPYLQGSSSPLKRVSKPGSGPQSRGVSYSPRFDDDDPTLPMNIPLPRGSRSPEKGFSVSPPPAEAKTKEASMQPSRAEVQEETSTEERKENYFRVRFSTEVQHRTDTVENILQWIRHQLDALTESRTSLLTTIAIMFLSIFFARLLTQAPHDRPFPDLIKVAGLARSFEPMIYYSENGIARIDELQETGTAVWDLGESMRAANMTSSPIIVSELDNLSDSLKGLAHELTDFFAAVDGDVDNIILVMEWAKRELAQLTSTPSSPVSSALHNLHSIFATLGMLSDPNTPGSQPTLLDMALSSLIARTPASRTRLTLERTFTELLSTMEETINSELSHTSALFALFADIDNQFLNLQRSTVRELDTQERLEGDLLSSLWTRALGSNRSKLKKYEKNKRLLQSVRDRTVANKNLLLEHNDKLRALKGSLENLRRRLVGPLFKGSSAAEDRRAGAVGSAGSTVGIEAQVEGLESTYVYLRGVRESQRGRVYEKLYGRRARREGVIGIEASEGL